MFYTSGIGIALSGLMLFARAWLIRCAPDRYFGSDVYRMKAELEAEMDEDSVDKLDQTDCMHAWGVVVET